jgi:hypothetical protein
MSPGSVGPGRGSRPVPLPASGVLEEDRAEFDQAQCALAPGDDGVHTGTVRVVGADAAVAIAVERSRITTVPAVALAGDEINECRFLSLLHKSPQYVTAIDPSSGGAPVKEARDARGGPSIRLQIGIAKGLKCAAARIIRAWRGCGGRLRQKVPRVVEGLWRHLAEATGKGGGVGRRRRVGRSLFRCRGDWA